MGAIDALLGIVDMKKASGLVLVTGEVPALLLAGGRSPLTMPPLAGLMMQHLLSDLLDEGQRGRLQREGSLEAEHRSAQHGTFLVQARQAGDKLTVILTRAAAPAATPAPAATLASPAPASPAQAAVVSAPPPTRAAPAVESAPRGVAHGSVEVTLEEAVLRRASDLLLAVGEVPRLRVEGELVESRVAPVLTQEALEALFSEALTPARRARFDAEGSVDFAHVHSVDGQPARFRVNLFRHHRGLAAALRLVSSEPPALAQLQLPRWITQLVEPRHGLVLVTGPTGSGKSTTLAALLEHVNRTRAAHVVTLEDPIEFVYTNRKSVVHQREVGAHVDSFASGLRAALRENPDLLLVGELRDPTTLRLALTAAQTGHLVLGTLHAGTVVGAVERLFDGFSEAERAQVRSDVAGTLRCVVAQQLLPAVGGGRVPALERLTINHAVAAQLREGRTHMIATQMELGDESMLSMPRALAELVRNGRLSRSTALDAADDPEALQKLLEDRRR